MCIRDRDGLSGSLSYYCCYHLVEVRKIYSLSVFFLGRFLGSWDDIIFFLWDFGGRLLLDLLREISRHIVYDEAMIIVAEPGFCPRLANFLLSRHGKICRRAQSRSFLINICDIANCSGVLGSIWRFSNIMNISVIFVLHLTSSSVLSEYISFGRSCRIWPETKLVSQKTCLLAG